MIGYEGYAPNQIYVKVITASYDEDLEMKVTNFLHNQIDENAFILNIHYSDNITSITSSGVGRWMSAIITYAIED